MSRKLCNKHIHELNFALKRKGLGHLISKSDEEARAKAMRWVQGTTPEGEFDPLVVSVLEIYKKAADMVGQRAVDGCALCLVHKELGHRALYVDDLAQSWIDNISDHMLATCLFNGLMKVNGHARH